MLFKIYALNWFMLIKMLLYRKKNTSWELPEQIWFQEEKSASWKYMFDINKMSPIPIKIIYLYKL